MRVDRFGYIAFIVGLFAAAGFGAGIIGWLVASWGEAAFVGEATGGADQIGPAFVALLYLVLSATTLLTAPTLAVVFGLLFGSRLSDSMDGVVVGGVGAGIGTMLMALLANALFLLTQGSAASQAHSLLGVLWLIAVAAVVAGVLGAVAGAIGSELR